MFRKINLLVLFVVLFISCGCAQQKYKKFRVDVGGGWGYSFHKGGGGLILAIEPKYVIIANKLSLGLRYEAVSSRKDDEGPRISLINRSYLLTGDYYYFTWSNVRPFVGLGLGAIHNVAVSDSVTYSKLTNFGGLIRAGLDVDRCHCRFALEYNQVPTTKFSLPGANDVTVKNSYIGITFSAYYGGGRKR